MKYTRLALPDKFPNELTFFISGSIEPYLMDVHAMLITIGPTFDEDQPPHLLTQSIALVLLTVVSAAADTLYTESGTNAEKFKGTLNAYYPWRQCQEYGPTVGEAAELLYTEFRNPISHRAGIRPAGGKQFGVFMTFPGSGDAVQLDTELVELEKSKSPPSNLTLNDDSATCHLDVRTFYWGVRKMIEAMADDEARWDAMIEWLKDHKFVSARHRPKRN